eukprot:scaffold11600_cov256-Chaetoceros_neogracile.AAC.6
MQSQIHHPCSPGGELRSKLAGGREESGGSEASTICIWSVLLEFSAIESEITNVTSDFTSLRQSVTIAVTLHQFALIRVDCIHSSPFSLFTTSAVHSYLVFLTKAR